MSLSKYHSDEFFDQFPSLFHHLWNNGGMNYSNMRLGTQLPAVNVEESEKSFRISMAAPGMKKDDFKIAIHKGVLSISSEKEEERKEDNKHYKRREFCYTKFQRSFTLPETIEQDKVKASYKDGLLIVEIPKNPVKIDHTKQIEVQ